MMTEEDIMKTKEDITEKYHIMIKRDIGVEIITETMTELMVMTNTETTMVVETNSEMAIAAEIEETMRESMNIVMIDMIEMVTKAAAKAMTMINPPALTAALIKMKRGKRGVTNIIVISIKRK